MMKKTPLSWFALTKYAVVYLLRKTALFAVIIVVGGGAVAKLSGAPYPGPSTLATYSLLVSVVALLIALSWVPAALALQVGAAINADSLDGNGADAEGGGGGYGWRTDLDMDVSQLQLDPRGNLTPGGVQTPPGHSWDD